ncbi:unnamed protein product, partial [marine sediment metagenome]
MALKVPLKNPKPDFEEFKRVVKGEKGAERVHFVELFPDPEIVSSMADILEEKPARFSLSALLDSESLEEKKNFLRQWINWWYKMGYDYTTIIGQGISGLIFPGKSRKTKDTALISRKERTWVEEGKGMINSWEDFEKYPWPNPDKINYSLYEF